jgi:hypothetical protein
MTETVLLIYQKDIASDNLCSLLSCFKLFMYKRLYIEEAYQAKLFGDFHLGNPCHIFSILVLGLH